MNDELLTEKEVQAIINWQTEYMASNKTVPAPESIQKIMLWWKSVKDKIQGDIHFIYDTEILWDADPKLRGDES
jgi:hypothetical protein